MTQADEILIMIENVSPDDSDKLDEIDARVDCYLNNFEFARIALEDFIYIKDDEFECGRPFTTITKYTRSRDALKAIRPEGWMFTIFPAVINSRGKVKYYVRTRKTDETLQSRTLPTEELAELHAIIQAIEWERNNET